MMRKLWPWVAGILILIGAPVSIAAASGAQIGQVCTVAADELIPGNLNAVCQSLTVEGTVSGDVLAVAGEVTINGTVQGDVTAIARQVTINGTVGGDVRTLAARLLIAPGARLVAPRGDVAGIGLSGDVMAPVSGDFLFAGYQATLSSSIGGNAQFYGSALVIRGPVQGRAEVTINRVLFQPPDLFGINFMPPGLSVGPEHGSVKGDLHYQAPAPVDIAPGLVGGSIRYVPGSPDDSSPLANALGDYGQGILRDLLALMVVGVVVLIIAQNGLVSAARQLQMRWGSSFVYGLVAMLLFIPACFLSILVSVAILGLIHLITLGELTATATILLLITNLALIVGFAFAVGFLARLVVCYVIGLWIGRRLLTAADRVTTLIISLLLGVLLYAVIANLGAIGLFLSFVVVCFGLGGLMLAARDSWFRRQAPRSSQTRALTVAPTTLPVPLLPSGLDAPPPYDDTALGMDNLPEGFTWFDS